MRNLCSPTGHVVDEALVSSWVPALAFWGGRSYVQGFHHAGGACPNPARFRGRRDCEVLQGHPRCGTRLHAFSWPSRRDAEREADANGPPACGRVLRRAPDGEAAEAGSRRAWAWAGGGAWGARSRGGVPCPPRMCQASMQIEDGHTALRRREPPHSNREV